LIDSPRKLKINYYDARDTYALSLIIDINRKFTLGLKDFFDKYNVLRLLKRPPIALFSLKTYGFLQGADIDGASIFFNIFFVPYVRACKLILSKVASAVSRTQTLFTTPDISMSLPAHSKVTNKQPEALRNLHGLDTEEELLDHVNCDASKDRAYLTAEIAAQLPR